VKRRTAFLFDVYHRDGSKTVAIFYALTAAEATRYARAWAQRLGHCRVELVVEDDNEVAA
jgi:hypothetical protein